MENERSYRQLRAWQLGMTLAKSVYLGTERMPSEEKYDLTRQIRRAAVSVPANIAEGYGRGGRGEYLQFLGYSTGSLFELETYLLLAADLNLIDVSEMLATCSETGKVLNGLKRSLKVPSEKVSP